MNDPQFQASSQPYQNNTGGGATDREAALAAAGPVQIGSLLGMPASTVHEVLVRAGINRLSRPPGPSRR